MAPQPFPEKGMLCCLSEVVEEPDDVGKVDPAVAVVVERDNRLVRRYPGSSG